MTNKHLAPQRYFELIDADTERLLEVARRGLDAEVPCCPGWTVGDVVTHLAEVYEHKVRVMADNAWPDPWPPGEPVDGSPVDRLADAKAHLFAEFAEHEISEATTTFSAEDRTISFWARRMALEVAIHRFDVELAHDVPTPTPADLALDGIDEALRIFLAGPWWETRVTTAHPVDAVVAVEASDRRWLCAADATSVIVTDDLVGAASATLSGDPTAVFRWLWGRAGDEAIDLAGSSTVVTEFRGRLVECTG